MSHSDLVERIAVVIDERADGWFKDDVPHNRIMQVCRGTAQEIVTEVLREALQQFPPTHRMWPSALAETEDKIRALAALSPQTKQEEK